MTTEQPPVLIKSPPWQLMQVSTVHLLWAACLVWYPPLTELILFIGLDWLNEAGINNYWQAAILGITSALALTGIKFEDRLTRKQVLATLIPQFAIVLISLGFDAVTIVSGYESESGNEIHRAIVVALLGVFVIIAIFHTLAVRERYGYNWTGR